MGGPARSAPRYALETFYADVPGGTGLYVLQGEPLPADHPAVEHHRERFADQPLAPAPAEEPIADEDAVVAPHDVLDGIDGHRIAVAGERLHRDDPRVQ